MIRVVLALLVLLALQFVPGVGVGDVRAGCIETNAFVCDTRGEAYSAVNAVLSRNCGTGYGAPTREVYIVSESARTVAMRLYCTHLGNGTESVRATTKNGTWPSANGGCPVGTTWNDTTKTCFSADRCLSMDNYGEGGTSNLSFSAHRCKAGCSFDYIGETQELTTGVGAVIKVGVQGKWKANGAACQAGDMDMEFEDENPPPVSCTPTEDNQTLCVKATGEQCYSAGSGRQICWRPGETGEKVDGPVLQKRVAGPTVGEPGRTPPYGAMYEPAAAGVKIIAEYGGFRTSSTPGDPPVADTPVGVTTTTQNFKTTNNVNAGGSDPDQGENVDGSPGSTPGNQGPGGSAGEGGNGGSASGGDSCDVPPVCSGDPINCAVLKQVWSNRCSENGNAASYEGCSEGGTVQAFSCSGDGIMCKQLLTAREAECKAQAREGAIAGDAASDDGGGEFDGDSLWGTPEGTGEGLDGDLIVLEGGELFPEIEFAPGAVFKTPDGLGDLLAKIRMIIVAGFMVAAAFVAGRS